MAAVYGFKKLVSTSMDVMPPPSTMKVKFVRPPTGVKLTSFMRDAFSLMTEEEEAGWIDEEEIDKVGSVDATTTFFICQEFSGMAFEKLKTMRFRIVSPQCVIMCTQRQEPIPKVKYPILSVTMSGLIVCCTSICRQLRIELHEKIQLMGGEVMKELTSRTTHLVCGEVGSRKYHVACKLRITIMLPGWIEECYKRCSKEFIHATDPVFDCCRCAIFHGFNVTVSNLDSLQRREVEKLITENGGIYCGDLRVDVTTHLILEKPQGRKYFVAKRKSIPCLKLAWVLDSVEKGFCLDPNLYLIDDETRSTGKVGSSTPVKNQGDDSLPNCSNLSSINGTVNETVSDVSVTPSASTKQSENKENKDATDTPEKWLENVDLSVVSKSGLFLDGCKILLSGFPLSTTEKMRKILNYGGATRFSQLNDSVSHVVVGGKLEPEHKKLLEEQFTPHVVHVGWIAESLKLNKPAEESSFNFTSQDFPVPYTLNSTTFSDHCVTAAVEILPKTMSLPNESSADSAFDDVIVQYLDKSSTFAGKVFNGLTFGAAGFNTYDVAALKEMIKENGGEFYEDPLPSSMLDYGIVPIPACRLSFKSVHVVTNYWLQNCVTEEALLDISEQPIYGPIAVDRDARPLKNCVLCFSQYSGAEKECLVHISSLLGAKCQEYFTRQLNRSRGLVPNTHLVAMHPEGSKYDGAISWGIPVVTAAWLINCLVTGVKLNESAYIVGNVDDETGHHDTAESDSTVTPSAITIKHDSSLRDGSNSANSRVTTSPVMSSTSVADLKTPIRAVRSAPRNDVFKTPSSSASRLPTTAERLQTMRDGLRSRYDFPCLKNNRVTDVLMAEGCASNTSVVSSPGDTSALDTSGRLDAKLNIRETMASLETPDRAQTKDLSPTSQLSIDELFSLRVRQALRSEVKASGGDNDDWNRISEVDESIDERSYLLSLRPLTGVIIAVSKKLAAEQGELNSLAEKLGAKCKWIYEKSCTHFVYRGKSNETPRELKLAKDDKKIVVSPEWIRACSASHSRLDESSFPYTYNPNMSLQVMNQRDTTPLRNSQKAKDVESTSSSGSSGASTTSKEATTTTNLINKQNSSMKAADDAKMRETTERKIEEILAATKVAKDKRKKGLHQSCLNISSGGDNSFGSVRDTPKMRRLPTTPQTDVSADCASEVVESVPITWDDPSCRAERVKLTARFQNGSLYSDDDDDNEGGEEKLKTTHNQSISYLEFEGTASPSSLKENAPVTKARSSYVFMFTGMREEERRRAVEAIAKCGGRAIDSQNFNDECTHIVTNQPSRSEKFLAGIAAGRWVLHLSYLEESSNKGRFVEESPYEWANDNLKGKLPADNRKLCCSARIWRQEVQSQMSIGTPKAGAFKDWTVIICTKENRAGGFKRLLQAGGATVLSTQPPFSSIDGATHAFLELDRTKLVNVDLHALVAAGVLCLKPEYICAFLSDWPSVSVKNFYLPEVIPLLASADIGDTSVVAKRKSDDSNSSNKRTRQTCFTLDGEPFVNDVMLKNKRTSMTTRGKWPSMT